MSSRRALIAAALFVCALLAGCGGGDDEEADNPAPPVAKPEDFPRAAGKTLAELRKGLGPGGPVLAPSVSQLTTGQNRFGFGLFDRSRAQIADASVAVYVAPAGGGEAKGPYPARFESLAVRPQFQSRQTATDPDSAKSVYVARIPFDTPGEYEVLGITRLDDRLVAATSAVASLPVLDVSADTIPREGDKAPRIHTQTEADVGGDIASIDTRIPPSSMHSSDFADVLGKKPAVLVFATPALCQSRVCGPVVDIAESVKASKEGEGVEFIHQEVFVDNRIDKGLRPQLTEFNLQTEPWLFAVDRSGKVAARLEGAFSERELVDAIRRAKD
ncbi:MAG TPA: hypothetical protein VHJ37_13625 [Thermoleophilaceae bacterium]|nr:hypothetical protein [Thermoleophilaceae bacterium]